MIIVPAGLQKETSMHVTKFRYLVDNGGLTTPGNTRRKLVLITYSLYDKLPKGTRLYDAYGNEHAKGAPATDAFMFGYSFEPDKLTLMGFPATQDDLKHQNFFDGPYRES